MWGRVAKQQALVEQTGMQCAGLSPIQGGDSILFIILIIDKYSRTSSKYIYIYSPQIALLPDF